MKRHRYSDDFKVTAVKMANHPDIRTQDVASALDIHPVTLSRWKKQYREGRLKGKAHPDVQAITKMGSAVAEYKRIRILEDALRKVQMENERLKNTIRFNSD